MRKQTISDISLILVTFFWGTSYYLVDLALKEMGPITLNAYRFVIAFLVAVVFAFPKMRKISKDTLKYSFFVGTVLFLVYLCVNFGVQRTTLSNAGFLCALAVILTPIFEFLFLKKKISNKVILSVILSLIGIILLTLKDDFSINLDHMLGDIICMGCALFYAIDLLVTEKAVSSENVNPLQLGIFQLGFAGLWNTVAAFIFEKPVLPANLEVNAAVIFLAVFCTGISFIIQAIAQKYTTASRVGIIFTLEPVFAAIVAYLFAGEMLGLKGYLGAVIMIIALIVMEADFSFIKSRKK